MTEKPMIIEKKLLVDLIPADYNPRNSTEKQEKDLKESLKKFGVVEPIVYNQQTKNIVGGHFRVRELIKLGYTEVECVIVDLSLKDEKELNVRLNANTGSWDFDLLANQFDKEDLEDWGMVLDFEGEKDIDYSDKNKEVSLNSLGNESNLVFKFSHTDYMNVLDLLNNAKENLSCETNEQTLLKLLSQYE